MTGTSILREWDDASKERRRELLEWFASRFRETRFGGELESECGHDIALLLPRILGWIRNNLIKSGIIIANSPNKGDTVKSKTLRTITFALDVQLASLQIFLTSTNAHIYAQEFQQADGLRLLLHLLPLNNDIVSDDHRCTIYRLLSRIIQRDCRFKEQLSRLDGEIAMIRGALASKVRASNTKRVAMNLHSEVWTLCRATLLEQFVGNVTCSHQVHTAIMFMLNHETNYLRLFGAQILHELISKTSFYYEKTYRQMMEFQLVPICVRFIQSVDLQLQQVGNELVHSLLQTDALQEEVCRHLTTWLHDIVVAVDPVDQAYVNVVHPRAYEVYMHMRSPFVHASQSINTLMRSTPSIISSLINKNDILTPIGFVLAVERPQSLKWRAALTIIHFVYAEYRTVAIDRISELFLVPITELVELPSHTSAAQLANILLGDELHHQSIVLDFFQKGWHKAMPTHLLTNKQEDDTTLCAIEYEMEKTMHELYAIPIYPHLEVDMDEEEDIFDLDYEEDDGMFIEDMDEVMERQLYQKLLHHFSHFRLK